MPLIETLAIEVGLSIAKSVLKLWLKDYDIVADAGSSIVDIVKSRTSDRLAQREAQRQFEKIGEQVGKNLLPLFESEGADIDENSRNAIALAVAETLNTITSSVIIQHNLEASKLANFLLDIHPAKSYHFTEAEGLLYGRIVSESCEYIIKIASQLPTFTENVFADILKQGDQLLSIAEQTLQEVLRIREQLNPKTEAARFELDYRRAVIHKLDEVQLFGTDVATAKRPYRLSVAYVTLSVEQKVSHTLNQTNAVQEVTDVSTVDKQEESERDTLSVDKALADSHYLLVRGAAGSGKTTLLQWIAVNSAAQTFTGPLADWNGTLPFYIRLRHHTQSNFLRQKTFLNPSQQLLQVKCPKNGYIQN